MGPISVPRPPTATQMAISMELAGDISLGLMMPTCGTYRAPAMAHITADSVQIVKQNARVYCEKSISGSDGIPDSECNKVANSQEAMDKRNNTVTYTRLTGQALKDAKGAGLDAPGYAAYSKEVRISDGRTITMNPPIPIIIIPASKKIFREMTDKHWSTTATDGANSFQVQIDVTKVSEDGGTFVVMLRSTLPAATADWTPYQNWPMPFEGTYTIDTNDYARSEEHTSELQSH